MLRERTGGLVRALQGPDQFTGVFSADGMLVRSARDVDSRKYQQAKAVCCDRRRSAGDGAMVGEALLLRKKEDSKAIARVVTRAEWAAVGIEMCLCMGEGW